MAQSVGGRPFDDGAGDVPEISGVRVTREDIENDGLMGAKRTGAPFVRITGLISTRHNGVLGECPMAETGDLHLGPENFGSQGFCIPAENLILSDFRGAEDFDSSRETGFC